MSELKQQITDICFENGGVTKPMVDKLESLIKAEVLRGQIEVLKDVAYIAEDAIKDLEQQLKELEGQDG